MNHLYLFLCIFPVIGYGSGTETHTVITAKTKILKTPGIIRKEVPTLEGCAKACLEANTIKCHFFKFVNTTKSCYLSETDRAEVRQVVDEDSHHVAPNGAMGGSHKHKTDSKIVHKKEGSVKHKTGRIIRHKKVGIIRHKKGRRVPPKRKVLRHKASKHGASKNDEQQEEEEDKKPQTGISKDLKKQKAKLVKHMHEYVDKIKEHVEKLKEAKSKITNLYDNVEGIKTTVKHLTEKYKAEEGSVQTLHKFLHKAYKKINENIETINQTAVSQKHLMNIVKKMKDTYEKLYTYTEKFNSSTNDIRSELTKIRKFEKSLKAHLDKMKKNSNNIATQIQKIKSSINGTSDNETVQKIKNNQIMIVKTIMGIHRKGKSFGKHLKQFHSKIGRVWTAMKSGYRRHRYLKDKLKTLTDLVENLKNRPVVRVKGDPQMSKDFNTKYAELSKLQTVVMGRLKLMEKQLDKGGLTGSINKLKERQLFIFNKLNNENVSQKDQLKKMDALDNKIKDLSKAMQTSNATINKLNNKIKMNNQRRKVTNAGSDKAKQELMSRTTKEYRRLNHVVNDLTKQITKMKYKQTKTTELTANYKNLLEEVKGLKDKLGNATKTPVVKIFNKKQKNTEKSKSKETKAPNKVKPNKVKIIKNITPKVTIKPTVTIKPKVEIKPKVKKIKKIKTNKPIVKNQKKITKQVKKIKKNMSKEKKINKVMPKVTNIKKVAPKVKKITKITPKVTKIKKVAPKVKKITKIKPKVTKVKKVEPKVTKITKIKPTVKKIKKVEPNVKKVKIVKPKVTNTTKIMPKVKKVKIVKPKVTNTTKIMPKVKKIKKVEPNVKKVKIVKPKVTKTTKIMPKVKKMKTVSPKVTKTTKIMPKVKKVKTVEPKVTKTTKIMPKIKKVKKIEPKVKKVKIVKPKVTNTTKIMPKVKKVKIVKPKVTNTTKIMPKVMKKTKIMPQVKKDKTVEPKVTKIKKIMPKVTKTTKIMPKVKKVKTVKPKVTKTTKIMPKVKKVKTIKPKVTKTTKIMPEVKKEKTIKQILVKKEKKNKPTGKKEKKHKLKVKKEKKNKPTVKKEKKHKPTVKKEKKNKPTVKKEKKNKPIVKKEKKNKPIGKKEKKNKLKVPKLKVHKPRMPKLKVHKPRMPKLKVHYPKMPKLKVHKPRRKKVNQKVILAKPKGKKVNPAKPKGKKVIPAKPKGKKVKPAKPIGTNYALRRKASQSSTHSSRFAASKAVDGVENTFTHTKNQKNPYWSVDLGKTVSVKQINIINRKNCCGNRLKNIAVTVGVNLNKMKHCSNFKGPGKNGQVIVLTCKTPISGRYVKILRGGKGFLSLAEVQVMGHTRKKVIPSKPKGKKVKPAKPIGKKLKPAKPLIGTNYALRRKASQSSTHSSRFAASKAVDGVENTFTHTKNQKNPYWSVDLGKTVSVKQINIINRKNCCGNRLKNIAVTVGVNLNKMKHCSNFKGPGKNGQFIVLTCKTPISGRYVKILRGGKGFLSLAEVQVMGHTRKKVIPSKPKEKKVKPAKPKGQQCRMNLKGVNYGGNISKTRSGRTCQAWGVQTPQKHKFSKKLVDQKNYCRNPDNEPHGPWCYTTDAKKRWEYCAIPYCGKKAIPSKPKVKKVKPAKPIGKKAIPSKPKVKKVKPAKPIGKKLKPAKPIGKKVIPSKPKGTNYALRRKASQSSTHSSRFAASKAVDGVENTFTHTKNQKNPYWSVDLGKTVSVKQINIINRKNCCGNRLKNIAVTVGVNLKKMKHCSNFKGPGKNGQVIVLTCKTPISGRYVKILRSGKGFLSLAEVQVMGHTRKKVIPAKPKGKKIIPAKSKGQQCRMNLLGANYGGNISKTRSGRTCQAWGSQTPQKHKFGKKLADQKNFCRNPDNEPYGPWCYTTDLNKRWEYCAIPYCEKKVKPAKPIGKKVKPAKPIGKKVIPSKPKGKKVVPAKPKGKKVIPAKLKGYNYALRRKASQSSTASSKFAANKAVDGVENTFTHTKNQNNPYWSVDLGKTVSVKQINIINRKDCCGNRLKNIAVTVGVNLNKMKHCSNFKGPGKNGQVIVLTCKTPISGRYVKILRSGKGYLSLAEVQVIGHTEKKVIPAKPKGKKVKTAKPKGYNYALRRKASQSSTHNSRFPASKAVDGVENTFTHTKNQNNPYWSVDLGKTVSVKQINIINRKNCCGNRLRNIAVTVGQNLHKMEHCSNFKGPGKNGQFIVLTCKTPISGRYVKILRSGKGYLSLAEVQVLGHTEKKVIPAKPKGKKVKTAKPKGKKVKTAKPKGKKVKTAKPKGYNYALRRKASQSSTHNSRFPASKAVDGVENTFTHTKHQNNPYWSVDLGKTVSVKQINIINRKNCCGNRLRNIAVTVGQNLHKMEHCSNFKGPGKNGQFIVLTCKTPISGRYVKILRSGKGYLSLAEVQVIGHTEKKVIPAKPKGKKVKTAKPKGKKVIPAKPKGINYALRRKASQSSTYHSKYAASQAVDGEENTFTATKKQNNAYWSVDLGKAVNVKQINIINRKDCCGKWLKNIAVTVGQNLNSMKHCSKFKGPGKNGQVIELTCKSPIAGRYVKILRSGKGILGLAEVQVIGNTGKQLIPAKPKGKIVKPAKPKGYNYALRRKASQSSTHNSRFPASKAVDGVENTFTHTKHQNNPYWSVDLGKTVSVKQINIINRKNCCGNRLRNIVVTVGQNLYKMEHCSNFKGPGKNGQFIVLTCKTPISGRYVKILRSGKGYLSLAEVQVIGHTEKKVIPAKPKGEKVKTAKPKGKKVIPAKPKGINYALRRKASQSSTYHSKYAASQAVDGEENTFTATKKQNNAYWSVDLGKAVNVKQINIINRKDCCGKWLKNIAVTVGQNLNSMKHCSKFKGPGKNGQVIELTCKSPIAGRYVKILRSGKGILGLAEVQVIGNTGKPLIPAKPKGKIVKPAKPKGYNYALRRKASQSSTHNSRFPASKAVDGVENTFTHTKHQNNPYWSVDLGKTVSVKQINIINRKNCCGNRLRNIAVTVGQNLHKMEHCSNFKGPGKNGQFIVLTCKTPISGRYVKILRSGKGYLSLAEVQVIGHTGKKVKTAKPKGKKAIPAKPKGTNYALRRKASQSSTYSSRHAASKAVDGVENTVTATKKQNNPYWSVDLGKTVKVKQINIINRKDCCGKRLQNIAVTVGVNLHKMKHCSNFKGPGKNGQFIVLTCKTPISGRYVKILRSGKGFLSLAEVQVIGHTEKKVIPAKPKGKKVKTAKRKAKKLIPAKPKEHNYALGRHAWQTRTHYSSGNKKYIPSWAVDGNENTFTLTVASRNPYWTVDLGKTVHVKQINIINRKDCCGHRLKNIEVKVGLNHNKMKHCSNFKGPGKTGQVIMLACKTPISGRYVTILKRGKWYLSLAEVQVLGYTGKEIRRTKRNVQVLKRAKRSADDDLLLGEDLALGLEAKQSSWARRYAYVSQNGMDGVTDSLVETQRGQNPYWTVQLPKEEKIKGVVFINRVDCCGARFNNIQVMIGGKECATFKGPGEKGEIIPLRCSHPLTGKKVEVLLKGNGILSFAEIKIIAAEDADTEEFVDKAFKKNLKPDDFYAVLEKDVKPSERKDDQTIGLKKVALRADGYTTEQISSLSRDTTDDKGVDGSIHTYAHTKKQLDPWWIVDLTKNYKVKKIKVLSRTSKAGGGKNFKMVTALVGPDKENMKECGSFKGPAKRSQFITFNCKEPVNGKFVKLQSKGINSLSFAELQVYAIH
ncbi:uncharacterized protein [Mytilus edulis]|uniref:uncharacterized protein n=1 Tax=Mytilus edulis TaxID=6550 RepID=UPI0039EFA427